MTFRVPEAGAAHLRNAAVCPRWAAKTGHAWASCSRCFGVYLFIFFRDKNLKRSRETKGRNAFLKKKKKEGAICVRAASRVLFENAFWLPIDRRVGFWDTGSWIPQQVMTLFFFFFFGPASSLDEETGRSPFLA